MSWTFEHPLLYCLPVVICLIIHIYISAAFIVASKPGWFRVFLYLVSSIFLLAYFLLINHCVTLATTKIEINFPGKYLRYQNQYGAVRITAQDLEGIILVGGQKEPGTIWIVSRQQTFYIDQCFSRYNEFLALLGAVIKLPEPEIQGTQTQYILKQDQAGNDSPLNISSRKNVLKGHNPNYIPLMIVFTLIAYFWGQKGWKGMIKYFQWLAIIYVIPLAVLVVIWPPSLSAIVFIVLYPLYSVFLTALCIPKSP